MCGCNKAKRAAAPLSAPLALPALRPRVRAAGAAAASQPTEPIEPTEPVYPPIALATVDTSVWGAPLWRVLHTASVFTKGRSHIGHWRKLLAALTAGLPCPECSSHYNSWYSRTPLRFNILGNGTQGVIINWVLALHNDVNRRAGRAQWSADQVRSTYRDLGAAKAALEGLQGIIGDGAYRAAAALLASL